MASKREWAKSILLMGIVAFIIYHISIAVIQSVEIQYQDTKRLCRNSDGLERLNPSTVIDCGLFHTYWYANSTCLDCSYTYQLHNSDATLWEVDSHFELVTLASLALNIVFLVCLLCPGGENNEVKSDAD